jgi:hypothetical protein
MQVAANDSGTNFCCQRVFAETGALGTVRIEGPKAQVSLNEGAPVGTKQRYLPTHHTPFFMMIPIPQCNHAASREPAAQTAASPSFRMGNATQPALSFAISIIARIMKSQ